MVKRAVSYTEAIVAPKGDKKEKKSRKMDVQPNLGSLLLSEKLILGPLTLSLSLWGWKKGSLCVINSESYHDLKEKAGGHF